MYEYAEEIEKASQRAGVDPATPAFSRQQVLEPVVLNLNKLVSEMEKMLPRLIGEDIDLSLILDPAISLVKVDPGQVEQVLHEFGRERTRCHADGGKLTVQTGDTEIDVAYARDIRARPGR